MAIVGGVLAAWIGLTLLGAWIVMLAWGALVGMLNVEFFTPSYWQTLLITAAVSILRGVVFK